MTFLTRAAELSVSEDLRTRRPLAAAAAALAAGQPVRARALLDQAEPGATDDRQVATALRLGGEVSFAAGQAGDAARQLLAAAKRLMPLDAPLGRQTLLAALSAANYMPENALDEVRAFAVGLVETPVGLVEDPSSISRLPPLWPPAPAVRRAQQGGPPVPGGRRPSPGPRNTRRHPHVSAGYRQWAGGGRTAGRHRHSRCGERLRAIRPSDRRTQGARAGLVGIGDLSHPPRPFRRRGSSLHRRAGPRRSDGNSRQPRCELLDRASSLVLARSSGGGGARPRGQDNF